MRLLAGLGASALVAAALSVPSVANATTYPMPADEAALQDQTLSSFSQIIDANAANLQVVKVGSDTVQLAWNPSAFVFTKTVDDGWVQTAASPLSSCSIDTYDASTDAERSVFFGVIFYPHAYEQTIENPGTTRRTDTVTVTPGQSSYFHIICTSTVTRSYQGQSEETDTTLTALSSSRTTSSDVAPPVQLASDIVLSLNGADTIRIVSKASLSGLAKANSAQAQLLRDDKAYGTYSVNFTGGLFDGGYWGATQGALPNGTYTAKVRLQNSVGWGAWSAASASVKLTTSSIPYVSGPSTSPSTPTTGAVKSPKLTSVKYAKTKLAVKWAGSSVTKTKLVVKRYVKVHGKQVAKSIYSHTYSSKIRAASIKLKLAHGRYVVSLQVQVKHISYGMSRTLRL